MLQLDLAVPRLRCCICSCMLQVLCRMSCSSSCLCLYPRTAGKHTGLVSLPHALVEAQVVAVAIAKVFSASWLVLVSVGGFVYNHALASWLLVIAICSICSHLSTRQPTST